MGAVAGHGPGAGFTAAKHGVLPILTAVVGDPDYILNVAGLGGSAVAQARRGRPWLAIHWRCCSVYSRIYRDPGAPAYQGRCPRCGKALRVPVGPGGTHHRFFEAC